MVRKNQPNDAGDGIQICPTCSGKGRVQYYLQGFNSKSWMTWDCDSLKLQSRQSTKDFIFKAVPHVDGMRFCRTCHGTGVSGIEEQFQWWLERMEILFEWAQKRRDKCYKAEVENMDLREKISALEKESHEKS